VLEDMEINLVWKALEFSISCTAAGNFLKHVLQILYVLVTISDEIVLPKQETISSSEISVDSVLYVGFFCPFPVPIFVHSLPRTDCL